MNKPIIEVKNLGKKYLIGQNEPYLALRDVMMGMFDFKNKSSDKREFWALKDIDFSVNRGDSIGIIGRNGAGKSTLLKILSRITPPTEGLITMRGRASSLLEVGTGFHPELTGRENIFLNGAILGMKQSEIKRNLDKIVDFAEINTFIDTPVKRYSSGMYVRLAFAVAAHLEPEILIVDEVLAVGDAQFQKKSLGKMESIGKEGRTVLFVSHNMSSICSLCQKTIWIDKGKIVNFGDTNEVVRKYSESATNNQKLLYSNENDRLVIKDVIFKNAKGKVTSDFIPRDDLTVQIKYRANEKIERPFFWIAVSTSYGSIFMASMIYDNFCPKMIEGDGELLCKFSKMPLLPGLYSVSMGVRGQDVFDEIVTTREIGFFNVLGLMSEAGFTGENADQVLVDSTKLIVPYSWVLPNGDKKQFQIKSAKLDN